jgi:hypothetical protein
MNHVKFTIKDPLCKTAIVKLGTSVEPKYDYTNADVIRILEDMIADLKRNDVSRNPA